MRRIQSLMLELAVIVGVVVQVNATDPPPDSIADYDSFTFNKNVGAITQATRIEKEEGDDEKGHHFTASRNFARKAAQSFMENVTENTSAVANYTATYNAKISNETNSKTLNLAHVYVNGVSFFLRGGANKTIDVYEDEIP